MAAATGGALEALAAVVGAAAAAAGDVVSARPRMKSMFPWLTFTALAAALALPSLSDADAGGGLIVFMTAARAATIAGGREKEVEERERWGQRW